MKECYSTELGGIRLILFQNPDGTFCVVYGGHDWNNLPYNEAACKLGACFMQSLRRTGIVTVEG